MSMFPKSTENGTWQRDAECVRIIRVKSLHGFQDRLSKWKRGGEGTFGVVYLRGNLCWKLSCSLFINDEPDPSIVDYMRDLTIQDGYIAYAKAIVMNMTPASIHAPHIKLILIDEAGSFAVLMERLKQTVEQAIGQDGWEELSRSVEHSIYAAEGELKERFVHAIPSLASFMSFITDAFSHSWDLDLHDGNVMVRDNGEIVVSDPISFMFRECPAREVLAMA